MKDNVFRFFVTEKKGDYFLFNKENLKHINVIRIKEFEQIICNYKEEFYLCELINNQAKIIKKLNNNNEFNNKIAIGICLIKPKKMKIAIEKAVELGVSDIHLFISQYSLKKLPNLSSVMDKYKKIILSSAKQSFRNKIPKIHMPIKIEDAINLDYKNKFIAHEKHIETQKCEYPLESIYLVGPEGGFSPKEISYFILNKWNLISLGKRILRAETATIAILSNVNYQNS